jgi:hypothetical protein
MLSRLSLLTLIAFTCPVAAQTPQPGWIADARTGCRVWNPSPQPNETISWTGGCSNGIAQGRGVLQWLKDGKPNERYEGEYRDGKQNGRGVYTSADGSRCECEYRDDKKDGRGVLTDKNGRYEGEFRDDRHDGRGVMTWRDGSRYEGEFRDGKANGTGTYRDTDGQLYSGAWSKGCFQEGNQSARVGATMEECGF